MKQSELRAKVRKTVDAWLAGNTDGVFKAFRTCRDTPEVAALAALVFANLQNRRRLEPPYDRKGFTDFLTIWAVGLIEE